LVLSNLSQLLKALADQAKAVVEVGICIGTACYGPDVMDLNEVMNQFVPQFDKLSKPLLCALMI
jgi:hypothetical protein